MKMNEDLIQVALLSGFPLDSDNVRNGVQAATNYLVNGLSRIENLELHYLTFRPPGLFGNEIIDQNGVNLHFLPPYPRFERLRNYRTYQKSLKTVLAKIQPDVIHAQGAASDALVALRSRYPTLVTAHGIRREESKYYSSLRERIRGFIDSSLTEQQVIRRTRYLIAISNYIIRYFTDWFRPDLRFFSIPNAVDQSFFKLNSGKVNQPINNNMGSPVIFFAGRVTPLKRVMDLVQAFAMVLARIPSAKLRIAGNYNMDFSYAESIRNWILQAGLGDSIHLLGELKQVAILQEYDKCNIFVLPSSQENAPMVIAQAMAAGKPVIASHVGGISEMLGENGERGILVKVGDIDGIAKSIMRLLFDQDLMSRMSQACKVFALENYHQDRVSQKTYEVYRLVVEMENSSYV